MGKRLYQQVDLIHLSVTFHQGACKVTAYPFKVELQALIHLLGKDLSSIFGHKDQMKVKVMYNMSFGAQFFICRLHKCLVLCKLNKQ
jgi:hypothetical protein